jgi:hypothetical protein
VGGHDLHLCLSHVPGLLMLDSGWRKPDADRVPHHRQQSSDVLNTSGAN